MKKRFLAMAMMIMLLMAAVSAGALAAGGSVVSGEYDTATGHIAWEYDTETKTLTLNGTGAVAKGNYAQGDNGWINLGEPGWTLYFDEIEHVVIGEGITNVAYNGGGFANCTTLETVVFPNSLNSIEDFTFTGCKNLREINLPKNLESIGYEAFADCDSCTSVVIPASVKYIGKDAFVGWTKYDWIYYEGDYPTHSVKIGDDAEEEGLPSVTKKYFYYTNMNNKPDIIVFYKAGTTVDTFEPTMGQKNQYEYMEITELEGWIEMRGQWRLFKNQKEVFGQEKYSGWKKVDGQWLYYRDNKPVTGLQELEGYAKGGGTQLNKYYFDENGIMQTGFFRAKTLGIDGGKYDWYFFYEPKEGSSGNPMTTNHGQMVINYYVESPSQGYISAGEQAVIDSGKPRVYRYYFDENGLMFTGWYNNDMSFDQNSIWRYFIEQGGSPMTSRLGRMCRYGMINEKLCYGNNGENHSYFFSSTGGMMKGEKVIHGQTVTFNTEGVDPTTDLLGALIK